MRTPTRLNLYVLKSVFGSAVEVSNSQPPTHTPHLKRCLAAGLLEVSADRKTLRLTETGRGALNSAP